MRRLGAIVVVATLALGNNAAAQTLKHADVIESMNSQTSSRRRDAWFDANAKGKRVTWSGTIMDVTRGVFKDVQLDVKEDGSSKIFECKVDATRYQLQLDVQQMASGERVACRGTVRKYIRLFGEIRIDVNATNVERLPKP